MANTRFVVLAARINLAVAGALVSAVGVGGLSGWARADERLPTDPALVTGELANGLKYIVRKHATPPGHIAVWMHVSSGSMNESEPQRGLAHYLEHMAFNGSKNFPAGSVVPFFESLGLKFGRDQNAFTSFDQTTYQLNMADAKPESLDKAMLFMSDVAFGLLLSEKEIESERQIIQNERTARSGAQQRAGEYMLERMSPESLVAKRLPIGTQESIARVMKPDFESYYFARYVPSNITVLVVGDLETEQAVKAIKLNFEGAGEGKKVAAPADQDPGVKPTDATRGIVFSDPELPAASVAIVRVLAARAPTTTVEGLRVELLERIADFAFSRRCQDLASAGKASFFNCGIGVDNTFNAALQVSVRASGKPELWKEILAQSAMELQRARLHGFTKLEVEDACKELIAGSEQSVKRESTIPARNLIGRYNSAVAQGEPIVSAAQRLEILRRVLPGISAKEVSEHFARTFDPSVAVFTLTVPEGVSGGVPSEDELVKLGVAALDVKPEPVVEVARAKGFLEKAPAAGSVSETATHAGTAVTSVWLSNGVRVHMRAMDTRKDAVTISVTLAGGVINETAADRGISQAAQIAWNPRTMATRGLSSTQIRDLMTGRKVNVGGGAGGMIAALAGGAGSDSISLSVSGSPEDLETGLQLAHLLLTEPVIEAAALEKWKQQQKQFVFARSLAPQGVLIESMSDAIYPAGETRMRPLTNEQIDALTLEKAQAWLEAFVAKAPIEVSVVGDFDQKVVTDLVATYLGSLKSRERISAKLFADKRTIARPATPPVVDKTVVSKTDQAQVVAGFFAADATNVRDVRLMELAAATITSRMVKVIREEKQLVYSIGARNQPADTYPGFGMFMAMAPTKPGKGAELTEAVYAVFDEFARTGPTAEELDVAKKQQANTLDDALKEPGYWSGRLANLDYRGRTLDDVAESMAAYEAFTIEDIKGAFSKYNVPSARFTVRVTPTPKTDGETKPEKPQG